MKPLDLSQSQVEGILQQVIQTALTDVCTEAMQPARMAQQFLRSEGEEILRLAVTDFYKRHAVIFHPQLDSLASDVLLRAVALFCQRESLDTSYVMTYLHTQAHVALQDVMQKALTRYKNCASDAKASRTDEEVEHDFYERVEALNAQRQALSSEMSAYFRPKVQALLEANDIRAVRELLNTMPECPTRMIIAAMVTHHQFAASQSNPTADDDCNAL